MTCSSNNITRHKLEKNTDKRKQKEIDGSNRIIELYVFRSGELYQKYPG